MRINFAHLRERSSTGAWVDFAVFEAKATTGLASDRAKVLADLTMRARRLGLKVDASALAFVEDNQPRTFGDRIVVDYLSSSGLPVWTHSMEV